MKITKVKPQLRCDELFWGDYCLYQNPDGFCFSFDAVILACFCQTEPQTKVLDAATGNGILPLLLLAKEPSLKISAVEIQKQQADLAAHNFKINKAAVKVYHHDMMAAHTLFTENQFDCIIANPPYYKSNEVRLSNNAEKNMSKVEMAWHTPTFFQQCQLLLKDQGSLTASYPASRYEEIATVAKNNGFQEKKKLWLKSTATKKPYLVLLEWQKTTVDTISIEDTLVIHSENRELTPDIKTILKEKTWRH